MKKIINKVLMYWARLRGRNTFVDINGFIKASKDFKKNDIVHMTFDHYGRLMWFSEPGQKMPRHHGKLYEIKPIENDTLLPLKREVSKI